VGSLQPAQVDHIETTAQRQLRALGRQQLHADAGPDRTAQIDVSEAVVLERGAQVAKVRAAGEEAVVVPREQPVRRDQVAHVALAPRLEAERVAPVARAGVEVGLDVQALAFAVAAHDRTRQRDAAVAGYALAAFLRLRIDVSDRTRRDLERLGLRRFLRFGDGRVAFGRSLSEHFLG